ncbi:MAG: DUF4129 domain-containing protein [Nocardioidaceae bacterium]
MTGNARGSSRWAPVAALPALALLGLLGLVAAATAGPVDVVGPSTFRRHITRPRVAASPSGSPPAAPTRLHGGRAPAHLGLGWIGDLLSWAMLLVLVLVAAFAAGWLWRHRWRRPPARDALDAVPLPEPEQVAEALADDAARQLAALDEGDARNGVVRCWLRLEEVIAEAGLPRSRAETSTEYTVRVLHVLDLDPRAVAALADLYREARFSEHQIDESAREAARGHLRRLHDELGRQRAQGGVVA